MARIIQIDVSAGQLPATVLGPEDAGAPAVVVVPSIFGPAPDLLGRLEALADDTLVVVPDPFWRTGEGAVAYDDMDTAIGRLADYDFAACATEMAAAVEWARAHGNGKVVAVGICFGGPFVLGLGKRGLLDGIVTWHGSRMESVLDDVDIITCPVHHHLGSEDPVSPPEAIAAIRDAFESNTEARVVVHDGATHGFSHDGPAYDEVAAGAGLASLVELVDRLR